MTSQAAAPYSAWPVRGVRLLLVVGSVAISAIACSGGGSATPLAPSTLPAALRPGEYVLVANPIAPCTAADAAFGSVGVRVPVTVAKEGATWVVRASADSHGNVVMRLTEGLSAFGLIDATGTISGTSLDTQGFGGTGPVTMTFAGAAGGEAPLRGALNTVIDPYVGALLAVGSSTGQFVESSRAGTYSCQQLLWGIRQPYP